jgi:hypothetical protein
MRSNRYRRTSARAPDVHPLNEPTASVASDVEQTVDSRAYAFAYFIREPSQLPADFEVEHDFEYALFLPQELVPRFEVPRYEPRLLLVWPDRLSVYSHPSYGRAKTTIRFADISYVELERFLADCSLIFFTPGRAVHVPFHGRDREYVGTFLDHLKQRLLPISNRPPQFSRQQDFGPELDYKFGQIEAILNVDTEAVVTRFFVPPREVMKPRLFRQEFSWTFGSEIILTRRELHLFSDDKDGYRQIYGFRASWVPLHNIADIGLREAPQSVEIHLLGDLSLKMPISDYLRAEAEKFVCFVREQIRGRHC